MAALAVLLIVLEPTANAVVHRLTPTLTRRPLQPSATPAQGRMTPLDKLASHHGLDWTSAQQRRLQQQKTATNSTSCDSNGGSKSSGSRVNITMEYGYVLVAEMNIGSPAQGPFDMEIDFYAQQPYILKKGARYSDDGSKVKGVQEFDAKSSNTSATQNADFTPVYTYKSGSVVSDAIQIGPLSTTQSAQVAKKVKPSFDYYGVDGTLGLGVSDDKDGSSFVEQVASQLDSPVLTLYTSQSLDWDDEGQGVLSFGDRVPETCKASSWQKMSSWISDYVSWPAVDTVSATGPADSNGCDSKLTANITIGFYQGFMPIYCSVQLQELFVRAAGARWSWDEYWFVVDDASKAVPVTFQTASGGVITVNPNDYLLEIDGTQYLYTYGFYDQNVYADGDYIALSQSFMNNHCLSMDMTSGEWSLADVKTPSEAAYTSPASSSSSSSSSSSMWDDYDYIHRKH